MGFTIKNLQENKINEVLKFHNKYLGKRDFMNLKELRSRVKRKTGIFLVAESNKMRKIIGIKLGYFEGKECVGRGIAVSSRWRRNGVGRALVVTFQKQLKAHKDIKKYVFGSATETGIPFHIAMGYTPIALIQFSDASLRDKMDLAKFRILKETYNKKYGVHQIYIQLRKALQNLDYLKKLNKHFPGVSVQYVFSKPTSDL